MSPSVPSFLKQAALATALLSAGQAFAADSVGLVVYNAQHETLTKAWVAGFTEETGIPVTVRNGDDTEMGNQIVQEGAGGCVPDRKLPGHGAGGQRQAVRARGSVDS